jgi:asparagine synthase (glutamine-hydrolysing)
MTEPLARKIALSHPGCSYKHSEYERGFLEETNHNIMLMDMLMYHPDDILVKVDRAAMAVSLETRVPMLDKDVVEFAWSLPIAYEREGSTGKIVLRDVLYRYVPKEMMERPKKGFSIPIDKWLLEPSLREWAEALIDRKTLEEQGLLDADVVWRIWTDFTQKGEWRIQIWYILMFQAWLAREAVKWI